MTGSSVPFLRLRYQAVHRFRSSLESHTSLPGCTLLPSLCISSSSAIRSRQFASQGIQLARKSSASAASNPRDYRNVRVPSPASYQSAEQSLARQSKASFLYKAPSHDGFVLGCYSFSGFWFTYTGVCFSTYVLHPPGGLSIWVQSAYAGITLFTASVGLWFVTRPHGIISRISTLPSSSGAVNRALFLQLQTSALVPFMKPRVMTVAAEDVTLSSPLYRSTSTLKTQEKAKSGFFMAIRDWLTMDNFITVRIKDRFWPMHIDFNAAWADEDGRTLDRVVKHSR